MTEREKIVAIIKSIHSAYSNPESDDFDRGGRTVCIEILHQIANLPAEPSPMVMDCMFWNGTPQLGSTDESDYPAGSRCEMKRVQIVEVSND